MTPQDRRLVTWLLLLGDRLPPFVDHVIAADVTTRQWNEFADILSGLAVTCRERGRITIDIGDSGGR